MIYLYMNKERHIMTIPTKNEMFAEFANCKNIDERIEYIKYAR